MAANIRARASAIAAQTAAVRRLPFQQQYKSLRSSLPRTFTSSSSSNNNNNNNNNNATEDVLLAQSTRNPDTWQVLLNRPRQLNALNLPMVRKIQPLYDSLNEKGLVLIKGAGGKAFCAGGDVVKIRADGLASSSGQASDNEHKIFFAEEYILNFTIAQRKFRHVALLNGVTMGGGVGLSVHGKWRVATDNTVFAMPETAIGFFCDVGGSFFLPRLQGSMGMWLALTGTRLSGHDVYASGIATHYVPTGKIQDVEEELLHEESLSTSDVERIISKYHVAAPPTDFKSQLVDADGTVLDWVNATFSKNSVEMIIAELIAMGQGDNKSAAEWAQRQVKLLNRMSPTSLKVVFRQLNEGKHLNMRECFTMEYRISQAFQKPDSDFYEGVRAVLVDRDNSPRWKPSKLSEVTDEMIDEYFKPLPNDLSLP